MAARDSLAINQPKHPPRQKSTEHRGFQTIHRKIFPRHVIAFKCSDVSTTSGEVVTIDGYYAGTLSQIEERDMDPIDFLMVLGDEILLLLIFLYLGAMKENIKKKWEIDKRRYGNNAKGNDYRF